MAYEPEELYEIIENCDTTAQLHSFCDVLIAYKYDYPLVTLWTMKEFVGVRQMEIDLKDDMGL